MFISFTKMRFVFSHRHWPFFYWTSVYPFSTIIFLLKHSSHKIRSLYFCCVIFPLKKVHQVKILINGVLNISHCKMQCNNGMADFSCFWYFSTARLLQFQELRQTTMQPVALLFGQPPLPTPVRLMGQCLFPATPQVCSEYLLDTHLCS